jgi:hypothetical protein
MQYEINMELVQQANAIARTHHPAFYCSLNQVLADQPGTGCYYRRAVKVWFPNEQYLLNVVYCDHDGDDEALLAELQKGLNAWAATETPPEDSLLLNEADSAHLLGLLSHSLTAPADRLALLKKFMHWQTRKEGRALAADLAAKIESRSPGVLTGRGWMPHGEPVPRQGPPPFATAA